MAASFGFVLAYAGWMQKCDRVLGTHCSMAPDYPNAPIFRLSLLISELW